MDDKKIEKKDKEGRTLKTWSVFSFPETVKNRFVAYCKVKGITTGKELEKAVKAHMRAGGEPYA